VEASIIDLEYGMDIGRTRRASGYWRAGVRSFDYEQTVFVDYLLLGALLDRADVITEVSGIGPLVGIGGRIDLGKRVRLMGDLGLAYILGEADYTGEWLISETTLFDVRFSLDRKSEDHNTLQLEGSLGVAVRVWRNLEVTAGYRFLDLQEAARRANFVDDINPNNVVFSDEDVTFDGPFLGLAWHGEF
jgi:hypothetical protein